MHTFELYEVKAVKGAQKFYELVVDDVRPMKAFRNEIMDNPKLMDELQEVYAIMDMVAKLVLLPDTSFKPLRNPKENIKEYEIKTKNLRVYCFKTDGGKIIVSACMKKPTAQDRQIEHFRNLKTAYLASLKP